jgi:hypothetical protein
VLLQALLEGKELLFLLPFNSSTERLYLIIRSLKVTCLLPRRVRAVPVPSALGSTVSRCTSCISGIGVGVGTGSVAGIVASEKGDF